jgi:hypothetical protein
VDTIDARWARLASLTLRAVLTRKGMSYAELAVKLSGDGLGESSRSVEGKVQRGAFTFAFFLRSLRAMNADLPPEWEMHMRSSDAESGAAAIFKEESISRALADTERLSSSLLDIGVLTTPTTVLTEGASGTFSFKFFLQCAAISQVRGLDRFVDRSDIVDVAVEGENLMRQRQA